MTKPLDPPAALRPVDAIRADLEHPHTAALLAVRAESVGDAPIGRLLRDVGPLVERLAAVERERDEALATIAEWGDYAENLSEMRARIAAVEAAYRDAVDEWDAIAGRDTGVSTMAELVGVRLMPVIDPANWAASPTPTGPEPAKRPCCTRPGWCACDPLAPGDEHCQWFGPATPEPTEETP